MPSFVEMVYQKLKADIQENKKSLMNLEVKSENAGYALELRELTLSEANSEISSLTGWAIAIITDGRKDGEPATSGTGCVAILDQGQSPAVWLRTSDYSVVVT